MKNLLTVLPDKYSEKDIVSTMLGVITDYVPMTQNRPLKLEEQVLWLKFEDRDLTTTLLPASLGYTLLLSIGTCSHFYFWGLMASGEANLLYCERNRCTVDAKLLPSLCTLDKDDFSTSRPILALCDSHNHSCSRWQVRFVSLLDHRTVKTLCFASRAVRLEATARFIAIGRIDCITILAACTLTECFTIPCVDSPIWTSAISKSVPFSLGHRWLAFSALKPVFHHLSRCGDASSDESEPLTSTMLNVNKRIWSSLSALASTVVSAPQAGQQRDSVRRVPGSPGCSNSPLPGSSDTSTNQSGKLTTGSPGYVTVVDLVTLNDQFTAWRKLDTDVNTIDLSPDASTCRPDGRSLAGHNSPSSDSNQVLCGTLYVNVHEHCKSGAVVAHFMAHRWATVALLKFDPTGSLLFTACARGHMFNIFRLSNHPFDERQTAVHHLYILERGTIPCEVLDAAFSWDSRWLSVSTNHGTAHVFPITPYGGAVTVRTHTRPYVVNRTSRYHRSSGLEEHHLTRPQLERGSADSLLATFGTAPNELISGVRAFPGTTSSVIRSGTCRSAPVAGLSPQCPHIGVSARTSPISSGSFSATGSGDNPIASTNPPSTPLHSVPVIIDGACACPPNAMYTTMNPRLPPYPEPCQLKPEARLRPHSSGSATTGAAAAALGVATGALGATTAGTCGGHTQVPCCPSSNLYHHSGPCTLFSDRSCASLQSSFQHRIHPQTVSAVDRHVDPPLVPSSGTTLATCFAPPLYLPPDKSHHRGSMMVQGRDPYASNVRAVDGLFALTSDLYLVEYNLHVGPVAPRTYGEKSYQEGSLRVECSPVGEWNLRTDSLCVPPFPAHHPFRFVGSDTNSVTLDTEVDHPFKSSHLSESCSTVAEVCATTAGAPVGWSAEDVASYWYSQVEITTHLGPLRRVWMGPQFTFRYLTKLFESGGVSVSLSPKDGDTSEISTAPIELPFSSDLCRLLPACIEPTLLSSYYACEHTVDHDPFGTFCAGGSEAMHLPPRSSFRGTNMPFLESCLNEPAPYLKISPHSGAPRLPTGRLLDCASPGSPARWRTRSGEPSRPISISGVSGTHGDNADLAVFIEGGSYPDSSLGGSLSSLISRGGDDLASCIADAIQDEDVCFPPDRPYPETVSDSAPVGPASSATFHIGLRVGQIHSIPVVQSSPISISNLPTESALSEADFPSHEESPHKEPALPSDFPLDFGLVPSSAETCPKDSTRDPEFFLTSVNDKCGNSRPQHHSAWRNCKLSRRSKKLTHQGNLPRMSSAIFARSAPELTGNESGTVDEGFCKWNPTLLTSPPSSESHSDSFSSLPTFLFGLQRNNDARFKSTDISGSIHEVVSPIADANTESQDDCINDRCQDAPAPTHSDDRSLLAVAHKSEVTSSSESCSG